jgi:hypothetical protein
LGRVAKTKHKACLWRLENSSFQNVHIASAAAPFCLNTFIFPYKNLAILTRGKNGDVAWEVCTFHMFMYFSGYLVQYLLSISNMKC